MTGPQRLSASRTAANGLTHLGSTSVPWARCLRGTVPADGSAEGAVVHNAVGTYLHGPVLPKNPHLADHLLLTALRRRYGPEVTPIPLDDTVEWQAHHAALKESADNQDHTFAPEMRS